MSREMLADYREECIGILDEMETVVEELEESEGEFPAETLQEFSHKIDRIVEVSQAVQGSVPDNMGVTFIEEIANACKSMCAQALVIQKVSLVPIFAGFWAETIEAIRELLEQLENEEEYIVALEKHSSHLQRRLSWLAEKVMPANQEEAEKVAGLLKKA